MKSYFVHVETSDFVTVEANSESEAEQAAIEAFRSNSALTCECSATVMHSDDSEDEQENT